MGKFRELSSTEKKLEVVTTPKWLEKKKQEKLAESKPQEIKIPDKPEEKKTEKKPEKKELKEVPAVQEFRQEEPSVNPLLKAYYFLEDGYYAMLDKIDSVIPVYKIIDPIDRVFPSFILFIALIVILILIAFSWSSIFPSATFTVTLFVLRADTNAVLSNQEILVGLNYIDNGALQLKQTDTEGKFVLSEVKKDSVLRLDVNARGFNPFSRSWAIDSSKSLEARLELSASPVGWLQKTINFKKSSGELVLDDILQVTFSCKDDVGQVKISGKNYSYDYLSAGSVTVSYTEDCDLYVSVTSQKYNAFEGKANDVITLQEKDPGELNGTVVVVVKDSADSSPLKGMKVLLFPENDDSSPYLDETTDSSGKAVFSNNVAPDSYYARAQDPDSSSPKYSCLKSATKSVTAGNTTEFNISCTKSVGPIDGNSIRVRVFDEQNSPLKARISLYDSFERSLFAFYDNTESAAFLVEKDIPYILIVSREGFFPYENANVKKGDSVTANLKIAGDLSAGTAKVFVDRLRNDNWERAYDAFAQLHYGEGELAGIPAPYDKAKLGSLGYAVIKQVKPGNYYATAFTKTEEGYSDVLPVDANLVTEFYVPIYPKRGMVKFNVFDFASKKKLTDFNINFYYDTEGKDPLPSESYFLVEGLDGNSVYSFSLEQSFYAFVSKEGFNSILTQRIFIQSEFQLIDVPLTKKINPGEAPKIDYIKIFDFSDPEQKQIQSLELGKLYKAEFVLSVDSQSFYSQVHLRAGSSPSILEKDPLSILSVEAPVLEEERRGKSFGYANDLAAGNLFSSGPAKWIELGFEPSGHAASSFILIAVIKVSDSVADINGFRLNFRALTYKGDKDNPDMMRDPPDTKNFSSDLDFLRAKTKEKTFMELFCDPNAAFCFSDSVKNSSLNPSCSVTFRGSNYNSIINSNVKSYSILFPSNPNVKCDYNYSFALINNSSDSINSSIQVKNSTAELEQRQFIAFKSYFFTSKTQPKSGLLPSNSYALPFYEKIFSEKEAVNSFSAFTPTGFSDPSDSGISVSLVDAAQNENIFTGFTELVVLSDGGMIIATSPEQLLPFIEIPLTITVRSSSNQSIKDASVDVSLNSESNKITDTLFTDDEGNVSLTLPALAVGDKVIIKASFSDGLREYTQSRILEVQSVGLYSIKDITGALINSSNPLSFEVLAYESRPFTQKLKLTNLAVDSGGAQLIEERLLDSNFNLVDPNNYLDKTRMDSVLYSYYNKVIKTEKDGGTIIDVNVFVDTTKTLDLLNDYFIEGSILMHFKVGSQVRPELVPVRIHISKNIASCIQAKTSDGKVIDSMHSLGVSIFSVEGSKSKAFSLHNISNSSISIEEVQLSLSSLLIDFASTESQLKEKLEGADITAQGIASDFNVVLSDEAPNLLNPITVKGSIILVLGSNICSSFSIPIKIMVTPSPFSADSCPTGPNTAPKILLDWSWNRLELDDSSYKGKSLCDKGNSFNEYIYCDAAQFSLSLAKKIARFKSQAVVPGNFSFQSYLMADSFSSDFLEDFYYYNTTNYFLVPDEVEGENALNYFSPAKMSFAVPSGKELRPGLYDVNVEVKDAYVNVKMDLNKSAEVIEKDSNLSVFYFLPFDGEIGLKDGILDRKGYGVKYDGDNIIVASLNSIIDSASSSNSSSPLRSINSKLNSSIDELNNSESRGKLIDLKRAGNYFVDLSFSPAYANPLLLEMKLNELSNNANVYYSLINPSTGSKININIEPFLEWLPADRKHCIGFEEERPDSYTDSKTVSFDSSNIAGGIEDVFKLSWQNPTKTGILSLYSAVFTPTQSSNNYSLKLLDYSNPSKRFGAFEYYKLYSADNESLIDAINNNRIPLNGVKGTRFNDLLKQENYIKSIANVLEMIKSKDVCVANDINHTVLKWNSNKLYRAIEQKVIESINECIPFIDTESPDVSITSLGGTVTTPTYILTGTATDNDMIASLRYNNSSKGFIDITSSLKPDTSFSVEINLIPGLNSMIVCAEDPNYNTECTEPIEVIYNAPAVCGNGIIEIGKGEDCEPGNLNDQNCQSLGFDLGDLDCNPTTCKFDTSSCTSGPISCDNDGTKDSGEECDGTDFGDLYCSDFGFNQGQLKCTNCKISTSNCSNYQLPECGDGKCYPGENAQNCPSDCAPVCGDTFCETGENTYNCPSDCQLHCGNNECEANEGENYANCPKDCTQDDTACANYCKTQKFCLTPNYCFSYTGGYCSSSAECFTPPNDTPCKGSYTWNSCSDSCCCTVNPPPGDACYLP